MNELELLIWMKYNDAISSKLHWMLSLILWISEIDKHSDNGSLLITSQYETNIWLNHFENQTVGEALLDRIVHRSHVFNLESESMRKKRGKEVGKFLILVQRHFNSWISLLKCPTWMRMGVQVVVDFALSSCKIWDKGESIKSFSS